MKTLISLLTVALMLAFVGCSDDTEPVKNDLGVKMDVGQKLDTGVTPDHAMGGEGTVADAPVAQPDLPAMIAWRGATPHLELKGQLCGKTVDYLLDTADAADTGKIRIDREYAVPDPADQSTWVNGKLNEVIVKVKDGTISDSIMTTAVQVKVELKRHDTQSDAIGTSIKLVPPPAGVEDPPWPQADEAYLEFEAKDANDVKFCNPSAVSGVFILELYSDKDKIGTDGLLVPADVGTIGGRFSANYPDGDYLTGSFTLNCSASDVKALPTSP